MAAWSDVAESVPGFNVAATSRAWPFLAATGAATSDTTGRAASRWRTSLAAWRAAGSDSWPDRAEISTSSVSGAPSLASWIAPKAWPDWPTPRSRSLTSLVPVRLPTAMQATTKTSQSAIARHGWVALQRAIRTVAGRRG